jgi:hypothetical protein
MELTETAKSLFSWTHCCGTGPPDGRAAATAPRSPAGDRATCQHVDEKWGQRSGGRPVHAVPLLHSAVPIRLTTLRIMSLASSRCMSPAVRRPAGRAKTRGRGRVYIFYFHAPPQRPVPLAHRSSCALRPFDAHLVPAERVHRRCGRVNGRRMGSGRFGGHRVRRPGTAW